jgi:hypothetical protein
MLLCSNELFVVLAGIAVGGSEEATGQYGEDRWPYSFSSAVNLNAKRARPPATIRPTQLTHFGTDQSPMITGQSSKIRTRWNSATKVKISPATQRYVFRSMGLISAANSPASYIAKLISCGLPDPPFLPRSGTGVENERQPRVARSGSLHYPSRLSSWANGEGAMSVAPSLYRGLYLACTYRNPLSLPRTTARRPGLSWPLSIPR